MRDTGYEILIVLVAIGALVASFSKRFDYDHKWRLLVVVILFIIAARLSQIVLLLEDRA